MELKLKIYQIYSISYEFVKNLQGYEQLQKGLTEFY
jgi:hypothetical protein